MDHRHQSFAPHITAQTRLLILGSLPGAKSLADMQYYAHPQNQFWRLLEGVFNLPFSQSIYPKRMIILEKYHIGLWDVIESAARIGSGDQHIKDPKFQDLSSIFSACPNLMAIGFNGGKAAQTGRRILARHSESCANIALINLPSSSAANTQDFEEKLEKWRSLAPYALKA